MENPIVLNDAETAAVSGGLVIFINFAPISNSFDTSSFNTNSFNTTTTNSFNPVVTSSFNPFTGFAFLERGRRGAYHRHHG